MWPFGSEKNTIPKKCNSNKSSISQTKNDEDKSVVSMHLQSGKKPVVRNAPKKKKMSYNRIRLENYFV